MDIEACRVLCDRFAERARHAKRRLAEERSALAEAEVHVLAVTDAQAVFQSVAKQIQEVAHRQICGVVTRALKAVGFDYDFRIDFTRKRGRTEAKMIFVQGDLILEHPLRQAPGGAIEVAAFALRLSCLMLSQPRPRRILILDEPFKHLNGEEHQVRVGAMVEMLATEMGVQMIIITDDEWLELGEVIPL